MANVNVIVLIADEDSFHPEDIFVLTINGTPIGVTVTDFGWTTSTLVYAEGTPLTIVITNSPGYYADKTVNTTAAEGTEIVQLAFVNEMVYTQWRVTVGPTTLGSPILYVDTIPTSSIDKIDGVDIDTVSRIDECTIFNGCWKVTITA